MNEKTISQYYLERYVLEELPEDEKEKIRHLCSTNPEIQSAVEEIKKSNRNILELYPFQTMKADFSNHHAEISRKPFPWKLIFTVSSAAAILVLIFWLPVLKHKSLIFQPASERDITLVKGIVNVDLSLTQLLVYRKTQDKVELLKDGEKAEAGDLLQLAYVANKKTYGMIFSIDGRGYITLHFPENKRKSTELEPHRQFLLPNAIELDDAPQFERFFFLTSESPIDVENILQKTRDIAKNLNKIRKQNLDLPEKFEQYSVLILKGESS
ncbi:MAG: hypothetical protein JXB26_16260 [Candidatus Aminicenantes bacterium]|nr:hypothetical protein [Candidatus Aminicenantes bacterium]